MKQNLNIPWQEVIAQESMMVYAAEGEVNRKIKWFLSEQIHLITKEDIYFECPLLCFGNCDTCHFAQRVIRAILGVKNDGN